MKNIILSLQKREMILRLAITRLCSSIVAGTTAWIVACIQIAEYNAGNVENKKSKSCMSHQHAWWSGLLFAETMRRGRMETQPRACQPNYVPISVHFPFPRYAICYALCNGAILPALQRRGCWKCNIGVVCYTTVRLSAKIEKDCCITQRVFVAKLNIQLRVHS